VSLPEQSRRRSRSSSSSGGRSFNPRDPKYRFRLWVVYALPRRTVIHVYWRRVATLLVAGLLLLWLAGTAFVWGTWRFRRGHENVGYHQIALPWLWNEARLSVARDHLDRGEKDWEAGKHVSGLNHLRVGLARVPDDLPRRKLLGTAYLALGRVDLSLNTLEVGVEAALKQDPSYLALLFTLLFEVQDDQRALALARRLMPPTPDDHLPHLYLALQAATALHNGGAYDQADELIAAWGLQRSAEGQLLLAQGDWERGHTEPALLRLERERPQFPANDDLRVRLIRYYRQLGRLADARLVAQERLDRDPGSPGPRLDVIYVAHDSNQLDVVRAETEAYLRDFSGDSMALQLLITFALEVGDVALAERIHALAVEKDYSLEPFALALMQARLVAQDYAGALAAADFQASTEGRAAARDFRSIFSGMRAVAHYALGDRPRGDLQLAAFLGGARLRANEGLFLARQLVLVGADAAAARALDHAATQDIYNQAALTELVLLRARLRDLPELRRHLPRLLGMRKPSRAVLEEALTALDPAADRELAARVVEVLGRLP
jgi:tetratricopeptide (TPR) repeat protein